MTDMSQHVQNSPMRLISIMPVTWYECMLGQSATARHTVEFRVLGFSFEVLTSTSNIGDFLLSNLHFLV